MSTPPAANHDPARAELVTGDVGQFWRAYDAAQRAPDSVERVAAFRDRYALDRRGAESILLESERLLRRRDSGIPHTHVAAPRAGSPPTGFACGKQRVGVVDQPSRISGATGWWSALWDVPRRLQSESGRIGAALSLRHSGPGARTWPRQPAAGRPANARTYPSGSST